MTFIYTYVEIPVVFYAKCKCKAGAGGYCKHVASAIYQLVDYKDIKTVPDDKTCTDLLQQWHVPREAANNIEFINNHLNLTLEGVKSLEGKAIEQ